MQSCVDSIPIPVEDVDSVLVFESDISPSGFKAKIYTSASLSDVTAFSYPEDLKVVISTFLEEDVYDLYYDKNDDCYKSFDIPKVGTRYFLKASHPSNDFYKEIEANMTYPPTTLPSELVAVREINTDGTTIVNATITLDGKATSSNYYHIVPFRKVTNIVEGDQEENEEYTGETEILDLIDWDNNNIHLERHYSKKGFLVDFQDEDISSNTLNLVFHTPTVIDYEKEAFTKIFYEVRAVTDYYHCYEKFQSRTSAARDGNKVFDPTPCGNITKGLGYFGAYNTVTDSISLQ